MDGELLLGGPGPVLRLDAVRLLLPRLRRGLALLLQTEVLLGVAGPEGAEDDRHHRHHQDHNQTRVKTFLVAPVLVNVENSLRILSLKVVYPLLGVSLDQREDLDVDAVL